MVTHKNIMVYEIIKHTKKPVLAYKEPWMRENGLYKFRTIVSEVSSFVGNPVGQIGIKSHSKDRNFSWTR